MKLIIGKELFASVSSGSDYDNVLAAMGIRETLDAMMLKDLTSGYLSVLNLGVSKRKPEIRATAITVSDSALASIKSNLMPETDLTDVTVYDVSTKGPYFVTAKLASGSYVGALQNKRNIK